MRFSLGFQENRPVLLHSADLRVVDMTLGHTLNGGTTRTDTSLSCKLADTISQLVDTMCQLANTVRQHADTISQLAGTCLQSDRQPGGSWVF